MQEKSNMEVDLVYLWVNGNDPEWMAKRDACIGKTSEQSGTNCKGRYADNDELKYSLRSIAQYAPWIRRIFIVTDNQKPAWLDESNPKIRIVDHKEILPPEALPCFNSRILEHHLHKIPGLAEHFIFANDDMYLNRPVQPQDFFGPDGCPIVRMNRRPLRKLTYFIKQRILRKKPSNYVQAIQNSANLVQSRLGKYYGAKTHHNIDAYCKSGHERVWQLFGNEIRPTLVHHVRSAADYNRNIYTYVALAEGKAHLKYVDQHTSFRFHIDNPEHYAKLEKFNPVFFCMNDSEYAGDDDRVRAARFLENRFPAPSPFEKR